MYTASLDQHKFAGNGMPWVGMQTEFGRGDSGHLFRSVMEVGLFKCVSQAFGCTCNGSKEKPSPLGWRDSQLKMTWICFPTRRGVLHFNLRVNLQPTAHTCIHLHTHAL